MNRLNNPARLAIMLGYAVSAMSTKLASHLLTYGVTAGASDFIPAGDAELDIWSANFSAKLTAAPISVGLVAGDATAYAALHTTWHNAYVAAINPSTRTSSTIATKDTARTALVQKARILTSIAQAYPGTTNTIRTDFGITVPDAVVSPIGPPVTKPVVNVEKIGNLQHVLRIRDEAMPTSNAKPDGSMAAEVYVKTYDPDASPAGTPPATIEDCDYVGLATRNPYEVNFDAGDARMQAAYLLVWVNARGERGPVSDLTEATIAA